MIALVYVLLVALGGSCVSISIINWLTEIWKIEKENRKIIKKWKDKDGPV